jgi:hypothetical protein
MKNLVECRKLEAKFRQLSQLPSPASSGIQMLLMRARWIIAR